MNSSAILFPGQGCQTVEMLSLSSHEARQTIEEASDLLQTNLTSLISGMTLEELSQSDWLQVLIVVQSIARFREFKAKWDFPVTFMSGHSLGEIIALHCSGAFDFKETLTLVQLRTRLMQEAAQKVRGAKMIACMSPQEIDLTKMRALENEEVRIVCYNSPKQIVFGGPSEAVDRVALHVKDHGLNVITVPMRVVSHHPMLTSIQERYRTAIQQMQRHPFPSTVLSGFNGLPYEWETLPLTLSSQLISPFLFQAIVHYLIMHQVTTWIELGPKPYLRTLLNENGMRGGYFNFLDPSDAIRMEKLLQGPQEAVIDYAILECVATKNENSDCSHLYDQKFSENLEKLKQLKKKKSLSWADLFIPVQDLLELKQCAQKEIEQIKNRLIYLKEKS